MHFEWREPLQKFYFHDQKSLPQTGPVSSQGGFGGRGGGWTGRDGQAGQAGAILVQGGQAGQVGVMLGPGRQGGPSYGQGNYLRAAQQSDPQAGGVVIEQHFRQPETPSSLEVRVEGEVDQGVE